MELVNEAYLCLLTMYPEEIVKIIVKEFVYNLQKEKNKIIFDRVLFKLNQKIQPDFFENYYFQDWHNTPESIAQHFEENVDEDKKRHYHLPIKTKEDCYQIIVNSEKLCHSSIGGWFWTYIECVNLTLEDCFKRKINFKSLKRRKDIIKRHNKIIKECKHLIELLEKSDRREEIKKWQEEIKRNEKEIIKYIDYCDCK